MQNLIITILAIALTVAATAAAMFYGGDALSGGRDRAEASTFVTGGQQIVGAIQMHHANEAVYVDDLATLITEGYLNGFPVVKNGTDGTATNGGWSIDNTNRLISSAVAAESVCETINKQAGSDDGTLASLDGQLFGCVDGSFQMRY